ncbi:MAG: hypothetical protein RBS28_02350 [Rhodocyclaceae bacterium]|jgi:hypothetical protein|nr:hypothetical protein [Rhodocyclaceae bacterium]
MLDRTGVIFCSAGVVIATIACSVGFALAAMPPETLQATQAPVPPESLPDVVIPGFGTVSVPDLMGYYIDNPPAPPGAAGSAAPAVQRFGGC